MRSKISFIIKSFLFFAYFNGMTFGQSVPIPQIKYSPKKYVCYQSNKNIKIDGKLDDADWQKAEWTDDFVDIEGSVKPTPRYTTKAKMLWDKKYLYVAAELHEPDIWATLKNRDAVIFYDNDFEIFIDPDGDTHSYCEFEINALNTVWDLLLIQPYRDIDNAAVTGWDIKGLKTGVAINGTLNRSGDKDKSWTVEIAFPWEAFKEISFTSVPPGNEDQWRINFSRVEWKTETKNGKYQKQINPATNKFYPENNWVWSPQEVVNMHYPEMWGYLQFAEAKVGKKKIPFIEKNDEAAKWFLRQIYYHEKLFFKNHKMFSSDFAKLGIGEQPIPGYSSTIDLQSTTNMFEASLLSEDGKFKMNIRNDGRVWKSEITK